MPGGFDLGGNAVRASPCAFQPRRCWWIPTACRGSAARARSPRWSRLSTRSRGFGLDVGRSTGTTPEALDAALERRTAGPKVMSHADRKGRGVSFMEGPDGVALFAAQRAAIRPRRWANGRPHENEFCTAMVDAFRDPALRVLYWRPRLHGARAAAGRAGRPFHQRGRGRAEHGDRRRRASPASGSSAGPTASPRSSMPARSSRSATTSACTISTSRWSATAAATATA